MNGCPPSPAIPPSRKGEEFLFIVAEKEKGLRLDVFLAARLGAHGISREKVKRLVREGKATVDGVQESSPRTLLPVGSRVSILAALPPGSLTAEDGDIEIIYRDSVLAVINKPAGLPVHPSPGRPDGTLAHRLLFHFPELASMEGFRPGIVHRLDKDTSGLMIVALTERCRLALSGMFARHEIYKEYLALVRGIPAKAEETIEACIGRDPARKIRMAVLAHGKPAKSVRRTLFADPRGRFSLEAVRIFSGRTHQVRVHLRHIGHPLMGDALYALASGAERTGSAGKNAALPTVRGHSPRSVAARQMLHAWKLAFPHPLPENIPQAAQRGNAARRGNTLSFLCPPPPDFSATVRSLARNTLRVVVTGSPGCGKSALLNFLRDAGVPAFSADAEVSRLYAPGEDGHSLLRLRFGSRFVPEGNGPVDKEALVEAFYNDPSVRREVEALLHPLVFHSLRAFWQDQEDRNFPLAVAEIPLYLESGGEKQGNSGEMPVLIGVYCPFALREQRLLQKRGWTKDRIASVESWQWPEEKKLQACDIFIDNTGGMEKLKSETAALLASLQRLSEERANATALSLENIWKGRAPENFREKGDGSV